MEPTLEERLLLGQAMLQSKQLDAALDEFQAALEKAPELSHVHLIVGQVHIRKHQYSDAERAFLVAAQLDPLSPHPLLALGRLHLHCGDLQKAKEDFRAVLAIDSRSDLALVGLGRIALQRDCLGEAEKHLRAALEIVPDLVEALLPLAEIYRRNHRWDDAISIIQSAPLGSAQTPFLRLKLAEVYRDCHRYEALRELLEKLRTEYPFLMASPGPAQLDLITACFATGQSSDAVDQLEASTDYRQLAVRQQRLKGAAHVREGRDQEALSCFLAAWQWARESGATLPRRGEPEGSAEQIHALVQEIARQRWTPRHHPVVELVSGQIVAFESHLVRSDAIRSHEDPGCRSELLEASGLSQPLGWWHIFSACRHAAGLSHTSAFVGLDLTEQQLRDPVMPEQLAVASGLFCVPSAALRPIVPQLVLQKVEADARHRLDHLSALSIGIALTVDEHAQSPGELSVHPLIRMLRLSPAEWINEQRLRLWSEQAQAYDWKLMALGVDTTEQASTLVAHGCQFGTGPLYDMQSS